uniref:ATP synthase F0 subunit 6 n=1 Tax=Narcine timlei TaxID=195316 RepID=UPI00220BE81D|nr:ATP synthase F0 subunit 6 [Narcine timlei]UXL87070.1 ATP synthase F0 subunit 6 [Narcine timlei]
MNMTFFDQFLSPSLLGIPLIMMAITFPWLLISNKPNRWVNNRLLTVQEWFMNQFIYQLMQPINTKGHKWALILMTLLLFLITMNLMGLLPYTFTPTTQLSLNMAFALPLWLTTVFIGFFNQPTTSLAHFLPEGTPTLLVPILILIETISLFIRPLALGVRLTANLTAGHLLMQLIATAAFTLINIMPTVATLTSLILFLLTMLEVAVAMIQAYVFVLLLSLYLQENV